MTHSIVEIDPSAATFLAVKDGPRFIRAPRLAAVAILAALVLQPAMQPGTYAILDPTSALAQAAIVIAATALFLPVAHSPLLRKLTVGVVILGLVALGGRIALMPQVGSGFAACIQIVSPTNPEGARTGPCEKSYSSPWATDRTRTDQAIDFGFHPDPRVPEGTMSETNWNISAINATVYNYFQEGEPNRERLPLAVQWEGSIDGEVSLVVEYVGEGSITVGDVTNALPPSYGGPAQIVVPATNGEELALDFRWTPADPTAGPYAAIAILGSDGAPVRAAQGAWTSALEHVTAIALILGSIILLVLLGFAVAGSRSTRRIGFLFVGTSTVLFAVTAVGIMQSPVTHWDSWAIVLIPTALLLLLALMGVHVERTLSNLVAAATITAVALLSVGKLWLFDSSVVYRYQGSDFLTYEAYARDILQTGSLQAGEDIFVYSPGIRYWIFIQHLLFGDSDRMIFVLSIVGLLGATWFAIDRFVVSRIRVLDSPLLTRPSVIVAFIGIGTTGLLVGTDVMWKAGYTLLSEYPTWPLLAIALTLTLTSALRPTVLIVIGASLGLALLFRGNQAPGIAAIGLLALVRSAWPLWRAGDAWGAGRRVVALGLPFITLAVLPALHNLYFGGKLVLLQTSLPLPVNFPLPPRRLLEWGSDPEVAVTFANQMEGVLVTTDEMDFSSVTIAVRLIQIGIVVALVLGIIHRFRGVWRTTLIGLLPFVFLFPHIFIQVYVYYPRHVMASYFIAILVLLAMIGVWLQQQPVTWSKKHDHVQPMEPSSR